MGARGMAGILYANIWSRLTITLARGLKNKKKKCYSDKTKEPSAHRLARSFTTVHRGISNLEVIFQPRQESELKN